MGRFTNAVGRFGYWLWSKAEVPPPVSDVLATAIQPWDAYYGKAKAQNYDELVKRYNSWVYACANKNAVAVAQVPLRLYGKKRRSGTKFKVPTRPVSREKKEWLFKQPQLHTKLANAVDVEEVLEHPFLDLLANVNPFMNGFELIEYWTLYQELTGNAYTLIITNRLGTPQELWVLQPQQMKIVPDKEAFIKGYIYGKNPSKAVRFEPDDIMHMKYSNPANLYYGVGPLAAAVIAADAGVAMNVHEKSLLENNAIPVSALETEQQLNQDQVNRIKREWNAAYRGVAKSGKLAIFSGGLKPNKLSLTPKEMGYLMGRKVTTEEVASIFGVPMSKLKVGDIAKAPVGGMYHGNITYQRDTVQPKLRRIDQKLTEQLLPMYDPKLFCCFDNPVGEDKDARLKERESNLRTGYSSINEERARDNQEPVDWGEVPLMPSNLVPLGSTAFSPSLSQGRAVQGYGPALHSKYIDPDDLPQQRDSLVSVVKQMFRMQAKEMLGVMPKSAKGSKMLEEFWLPDQNKWDAYLVKRSEGHIAELVAEGGRKGMDDIGMSASAFDIHAPQIQEFVKHHTYKFSFAVNAETNDMLRNVLGSGLNAGENMSDLRKRVQSVFGDMEDYRAERIARTESTRAVNAGMEKGWEESRLVEAKEWNGASDMCPFCQEMNTRYGAGTGGIPLGQSYVQQGEGLEAGDQIMSTNYGAIEYPPLHPNCRCDLLPVLKEVQDG